MPMMRPIITLCARAMAVALSWPAVSLAADPGPYLSACAVCHRPDGQGVKGAFPALAGDAFVQADPAAVDGVVLNGRGGMPRFKGDLDDAQIAAAISYIRSAWGNSAPPVTAAAVAAVRARGAPATATGLEAH